MSDASRTLTILSQTSADALVIRLTGDVDLRNAPLLRGRLADSAARPAGRIVVDLSGVGYIDSSGVGTLVEFKRKHERGGGKVLLAGMQSRVRGVFEITKLDHFFTIVATVEEALRA